MIHHPPTNPEGPYIQLLGPLMVVYVDPLGNTYFPQDGPGGTHVQKRRNSNLNSAKGDVYRGLYRVPSLGLIKVDVRSLDYSS